MELVKLIKKHGLNEAKQSDLDEIKRQNKESILSSGNAHIYPASLYTRDHVLYCIGTSGGEKLFFAVALEERRSVLPEGEGGLEGELDSTSGLSCLGARFTWKNYLFLRELFPFTAPVSLRDKKTTIGTGDRLGLATPGHIRAIGPYDAYPVFAQQSIRELNLTGRNYKQVVADAAFGVFQEGFERGYGADGDHLKTIEDIDTALAAGMPMITLDLTEVMSPRYQDKSDVELEEEFGGLDESVRKIVLERYAGKRFAVGSGTELSITEPEARRCALMYWNALDFAEKVDRHLSSKRGDQYDLEISIDETTAPTVPEHHLFIIRELNRRGVKVNSIAPRFNGEFQKGIDYIGDVNEFDRQFKIHADIARENGNYKISIHSGSDKFSVYPSIGKHTGCRVHLKTAGTSWLEAVKTIALTNPALYRKIHSKAFDYFEEATKQYHVTTDLKSIPRLEDFEDDSLVQFFNDNNARQLIHITYGFLLNDPEIRDRFFDTLAREEDTHYRTVAEHIGRHIRELGVPRL
jgi:tagaturonate epimerase